MMTPQNGLKYAKATGQLLGMAETLIFYLELTNGDDSWYLKDQVDRVIENSKEILEKIRKDIE